MTLLEYLLSAALLRTFYLLSAVLPLKKDKVVLASARGDALQGNLAYIHRALSTARPDLRPVLLLERYSYNLRGKLEYLSKMVRASYHLATARLFIVDNAYLPVHLGPHRAGTAVIQVWHAAGALKRFGLDDRPPERAVENRFVHRYYDYVIVGSRAAVGPYSSALGTDRSRVLPLGTPRTDFFFDPQAMAQARERVLARHPALDGKKVVLYAPTFRGHGAGKRSGAVLDAQQLRASLSDDYVLVHKPHPVLAAEAASAAGYDVIADSRFDINELFMVTDVFITDYSSAVFEYALLRKPLVLLVEDLEEYSRDPGFYLDYEAEMIGEIARSTQQVVDIIATSRFDMDGYDAFIARHCEYADGRASERFVEFVSGLDGSWE